MWTVYETSGKNKNTNISILGGLRRRKERKVNSIMFEDIIAETFPLTLGRETILHVQESAKRFHTG